MNGWRAVSPAPVLALLLVGVLSPLSILGQNLTGEIDGVVRDSSGAVIPNATVTVKSTDQNQVVRTVQSSGAGEFTAPLLAIGNYSVTVTAPGFQTTSEDAVVHVNQPVPLEVSLKPGSASETVQVTANTLAPQLDTNSAGTLIDNRQITQLSLGARNFEDLLSIQPGISGPIPGPQERGPISVSGQLNTAQYSVNGSATSTNGYYVDGQDFVNHSGDQPAIFPGIDFVREISLQRSSYGAQYGGQGAAFSSIQTKSGSTALAAKLTFRRYSLICLQCGR